MMRGETRLVEDLLLATYASAGTLRLQLRRIDLSQTCRTISEMIGGLVAAQRLTLRFECEPTVPIVGDAERIQQIAWNLLSNAVKFTPPGGTVQLRIWSRPGWAMLTVRDTGLGIRPDFLEQVFEPFLQGESGTRRRVPGLGLGVHIVRLLAELHGGRVTVESEGQDRGTTVTVAFGASGRASAATAGAEVAAEPISRS
jgi:signal transduction histidine kinase